MPTVMLLLRRRLHAVWVNYQQLSNTHKIKGITMNTIELLEANYRTSALDAIAYADYLDEIGRLQESDKVRLTLDFAQKVSVVCQDYASLCITKNQHKKYEIDLLNGVHLRIDGLASGKRSTLSRISFCVYALAYECYEVCYEVKGRPRLSYYVCMGQFDTPLSGRKCFISFMKDCERTLRQLQLIKTGNAALFSLKK